jgi:hypothetical protein
MVPNAANTTEQGPPLQKATHSTEKAQHHRLFWEIQNFPGFSSSTDDDAIWVIVRQAGY